MTPAYLGIAQRNLRIWRAPNEYFTRVKAVVLAGKRAVDDYELRIHANLPSVSEAVFLPRSDRYKFLLFGEEPGVVSFVMKVQKTRVKQSAGIDIPHC